MRWKRKSFLTSHPFIIEYNDSKLCVIHIHYYLKYALYMCNSYSLLFKICFIHDALYLHSVQENLITSWADTICYRRFCHHYALHLHSVQEYLIPSWGDTICYRRLSHHQCGRRCICSAGATCAAPSVFFGRCIYSAGAAYAATSEI